MRLSFWLALCSCWLALSIARAGEFPFTGYISAKQASVSAGPGRRFYVTDHLPRGSQVEVYREDDAGWLAIRPPEGSFSWVPAERVERMDGDVGKIKSATESWIGTAVEQVKQHEHQVSLKPGELVQVLAEKHVGASDQQETWLKIAPPAGEFRYVHSRDVSREPVAVAEPVPEQAEEEELAAEEPEATAQSEVSAEPERFRPSAGAIALRDIDEVRSRLAAMREDLAELAGKRQVGGREVQLTQFKSSESGSASRSLSPDGFVPRKRRGSEQLQPAPLPSNQFARGAAATTARPKLDPLPRIADARAGERANFAPSSPSVDRSIGDAADALAQCELKLSLMVAQDRSLWNLAGLRQEVERLVESGNDPAERGRARLLLDKIKQFEETFDASQQGPLHLADAADNTLPAVGSAADPRYDARGWLKPVVSKSKPIAPYAIVDADGKPLCFITPSPGLNLGRYANRQVGLYGRRGYIESLKTPHVTAERVIDLDRL
jgi:SH3-like domain-containing protein